MERTDNMGVDFYNFAVQIIGEVPIGSTWLYDVGTLLIIIVLFTLFLILPIAFILAIVNR